MTRTIRHFAAIAATVLVGAVFRLVPTEVPFQTFEIDGFLVYEPAIVSVFLTAIAFVVGGYIARSGFVAAAAAYAFLTWAAIIYIIYQIALPADPESQWLEIARLNSLNIILGFILIVVFAYVGQCLYSRLNSAKLP